MLIFLCVFLLLSKVGILVFQNAEVPKVGISNYRSSEMPKGGVSDYRSVEVPIFGISDSQSAECRHFRSPISATKESFLLPVYKSQRVPVQFSLLLELAWGRSDFILSIKIAINYTTYHPCSLLQRACSSTSCIQNRQVYYNISKIHNNNIAIQVFLHIFSLQFLVTQY